MSRPKNGADKIYKSRSSDRTSYKYNTYADEGRFTVL